MQSLDYYRSMAVFLWPSLLMAAVTSVASSAAGTLVILRRESLLALALPQIAALGVALGLLQRWPPLYAGLLAVAAALLVITYARHRSQDDAVLPVLYVAGMSIPIVLIAHSAEHLHEIQDFFAGVIDISVTPAQVRWACPVILFCTLPLLFFWRRWLLIAQAPATAAIAGVRPARWNLFFLVLISAIILIGITTQGPPLVIASLFLPAAAALPWSRRLPTTMLLAAILSLLTTTTGTLFSIEYELPLSHTIAAAGVAIVVLSHMSFVIARITTKRRRKNI